MKHCLMTRELFGSIVAGGIISALLLPVAVTCPGRRQACAHHLAQLYRLGSVYASLHRGVWPAETGEQFWLTFTRTQPPLLELEDHSSLLACPVRDQELSPGETDYRGPRVPWSKLGPRDPIAADKPGNHGEGEGGYILFKDGTVLEAGPDDPLWKQCEILLRP